MPEAYLTELQMQIRARRCELAFRYGLNTDKDPPAPALLDSLELPPDLIRCHSPVSQRLEASANSSHRARVCWPSVLKNLVLTLKGRSHFTLVRSALAPDRPLLEQESSYLNKTKAPGSTPIISLNFY